MQYTFTSDARAVAAKGSHLVVDTRAIFAVDTCEQVPERERVAWARLVQHRA